MIVGLQLAKEMGATNFTIKSDSQLATSQVSQEKGQSSINLQEYYFVTIFILVQFLIFEWSINSFIPTL